MRSLIYFLVGFLILLVIIPSEEPSLAQTQPQSQWLSISVVHVKPDMLTEWMDFQKNEMIPTLQKGGVKRRGAWQTVAFGKAFEYVFVTPIDSFAQYDGESPIQKALGQEGMQTLLAKSHRFLSSVHTYAVRTRPDLSIEPKSTDPPKLAVVTVSEVAPGRFLEYESFIKDDVLPVLRKAGIAGFLVHQAVFGGSGNEYVSLVLLDKFADLDKGSPFVRVLGQEGANKLAQKTVGIVVHVERTLSRYNTDLSFGPPPQPQAK